MLGLTTLSFKSYDIQKCSLKFKNNTITIPNTITIFMNTDAIELVNLSDLAQY